MSSLDDINTTRETLMNAMGDKSKQYMQYMKSWFQMKTTKEEFDLEARKLLEPSQIQLHNQFLLQLFIKCSKLDQPSSPPLTQHRTKSKRRARQHNGGFQPASIHDYVPRRQPPRAQDEPLSYITQDALLPDSDFIYMRLMLAAWELGLKGAEQSAAEMLVVAVQHFLKNILHAVLSRRNGFKVRNNRIQYAIGMPVPNPWLKNTAEFLSTRSDGSVLEVLESGDVVPVGFPSLTEMQQDIALVHAAGSDCPDKRPVTAAECFEALQIHRSAVASHGVYSINMERIAAQLHHPSWDDMGD